MIRLIATTDTNPLDGLDAEAIAAYAAVPLDSLQTFLATHAPCTVSTPGSLGLLAIDTRGGFAHARALCTACQHMADVYTATHEDARHPVQWWLTLFVTIQRDYPATFPDDPPRTAMWRWYHAVADTLAMAILLDAPRSLDGFDRLDAYASVSDEPDDDDRDPTRTH